MQEHTKLSLDERTILFIKIQLGLPVKVIAKELKRDPSTIYREIGRNKPPGRHGIADYFPSTAHALAQKRKSMASKTTKIPSKVWDLVKDLLQKQWPPQSISQRIKMETGLSVSHESIYISLFIEIIKAGGSLHQHLRRAGKRRKPRIAKPNRRSRVNQKKQH